MLLNAPNTYVHVVKRTNINGFNDVLIIEGSYLQTNFVLYTYRISLIMLDQVISFSKFPRYLRFPQCNWATGNMGLLR